MILIQCYYLVSNKRIIWCYWVGVTISALVSNIHFQFYLYKFKVKFHSGHVVKVIVVHWLGSIHSAIHWGQFVGSLGSIRCVKMGDLDKSVFGICLTCQSNYIVFVVLFKTWKTFLGFLICLLNFDFLTE